MWWINAILCHSNGVGIPDAAWDVLYCQLNEMPVQMAVAGNLIGQRSSGIPAE